MIEAINERIKLIEKGIYKELSYEESLVADGRILLDDIEFINSTNHLNEMVSKKKSLNYDSFIESADLIINYAEKLQEKKDKLEYLNFLKTGNKYDFDKLSKMLKQREVMKKFPKFNFKRYKELVNDPVLKLENFQGETIKYDEFIINKLLIGINQLIFDEMDLRIINVGKEGAGKSCLASQYILYTWWFLYEVGLISYVYDVTKLFFSSVSKMLEEQDKQKDNDYGRIFCLDEGYELNRSNFREEDSRNYKDSMRSDRKMLRIEIVNLPQLGELELAITQTRTNFIFETKLKNSIKTSTLKKGVADFFIIPRGNSIYSKFHRREIPSKEVINTLSKVLKDKNDSYKGMPESIIIHRFNFEGVWGFDKSIYDKHIKKENKLRRVKSKVKLSDYIAYLLYKRLPKTSHLGMFDLKNKGDKTMYKHFQKFRESLRLRFETNPDLLFKYQKMEEGKLNED